MKVLVRPFARARDLVGADAIEVSLPPGATVGDLRQALATQFPALAGLLQRSALAIHDEFADDSRPLQSSGEVALLPPVSGGARAMASPAIIGKKPPPPGPADEYP